MEINLTKIRCYCGCTLQRVSTYWINTV